MNEYVMGTAIVLACSKDGLQLRKQKEIQRILGRHIVAVDEIWIHY